MESVKLAGIVSPFDNLSPIKKKTLVKYPLGSSIMSNIVNNAETKELTKIAENPKNAESKKDFLKQFVCPVRQSYGIILTREYKGSYQALVTGRRTTYAFDSFVLGRYSVKYDINYVKKLFNEMTADELTDILTMDFKKMWWRFRLKDQSSESFYIKKQNKFNVSFMSDGGKLLKELLYNANPTGKLPYEFPKGRKSKDDETDLQASMREFKEETNIGLEHYVFLENKTRWNTHISGGVKYKSMYYIAFLKSEDVNIQLSLKRLNQLSEVREITWMDINDIKRVDFEDKRLQLLVEPVFNLIKRRIHGKIKYLESKDSTKSSPKTRFPQIKSYVSDRN